VIAAATSWLDAIRENPDEAALAAGLLTLGAVGAGFGARAVTRRTRSLRHLVLVIAFVSLCIGALAAVALARLMVLDSAGLRTTLGVLALTAVFATVLVLIASAPLGRDARRLETIVRSIEAGDRSQRSGLRRADELGLVARAVDELSDRLDALERERAMFDEERHTMFSNIGHDLRTPLSALQAAVEALADGVAPDPDRYLRSMQHDVEALGSLVDDLFLLARIEGGHIELARQPAELTELVDEAVEALTPTATSRQVSFELRTSGRVLVDGNAAAIGRVIRNLLDNAVHHSPAGSTVIVAVSRTDGEAGRPCVRVIDEGPGFPDHFSPHAFDRFARADPSRNRATGGAGLGLAIARGLVEAHGGRIWIEQPPGGRVAFDLPTT
jgi:signal transduction histidine kinase